MRIKLLLSAKGQKMLIRVDLYGKTKTEENWKEQKSTKGVKEKNKKKRIRPILPARKMFTQRIILIVIPIVITDAFMDTQDFIIMNTINYQEDQRTTSVHFTQIGVRALVYD
jgi:hypothetical protein